MTATVDLDARTRAAHARWDAAVEEGRWVCDVTATDAPRDGCDCAACCAIGLMDWNAAQGVPDHLVGQLLGDWTTRILSHREPPRYRNLEDVL